MPWINGQWVNETPETNPNMRSGMAGQETIPYLQNFPGASGGGASSVSSFQHPGLMVGGGSDVAIPTGSGSGFNPAPYLAALSAQTGNATARNESTNGGPFAYNQTLFNTQGSPDSYGITFGPNGAISPERFAEISSVEAARHGVPNLPLMAAGQSPAQSALTRRYGSTPPTPSAFNTGPGTGMGSATQTQTPGAGAGAGVVAGSTNANTAGTSNRNARIQAIRSALAQRAQPFARRP